MPRHLPCLARLNSQNLEAFFKASSNTRMPIDVYMSNVFWWLNLVRLYSLCQKLCPKRRIESYSTLGTTVSPNKILFMRCWPTRTYPCLDPTPLKGIGLGGLAALDRWRGEVECVRCPANKAPWQHGAQHIANPKSKPLNPKP